MTDLGLKQQIERLYDSGLGPADIARQSGSTRGYVDYVLRFHRTPGVLTTERAEAAQRDHRHLVAIARASANRGFPYCVARS